MYERRNIDGFKLTLLLKIAIMDIIADYVLLHVLLNNKRFSFYIDEQSIYICRHVFRLTSEHARIQPNGIEPRANHSLKSL